MIKDQQEATIHAKRELGPIFRTSDKIVVAENGSIYVGASDTNHQETVFYVKGEEPKPKPKKNE